MSSPHRRIEDLLRKDDLLVNRYRVGKRIGAGAYGMIFQAVDETSGEVVAVKVIPPNIQETNQTAGARFQREMKVIRALMHPNIISLYDWGQAETGLIFMVLEYIDGQTLDQVVLGSPMKLEDALQVTLQLARALEEAHRQGVIHRDLKPANVMLVQDRRGYQAKVLDFGMAKVLLPLEGESMADLTREGMAVGTPRYIAPEQARGLPVGAQADIYALGLLLYEMLAGEQAVPVDTMAAAIAAHVSREPLHLARESMIPDSVLPLLRRMIEKDPAQRPESVGEVAGWLQDIAEGKAIGPMKSPGSGPALGPVMKPRQRRSGPVSGLLAMPEEVLELDFEKVESVPKMKAERFLPPRAKERFEEQALRVPETAGQWLEVGLLLLALPMTFLFVGAQAHQMGVVGQFLLSSLAPLGALAWASLRTSQRWSDGLVRQGVLWCGVAVLIAHLAGPANLAEGLVMNPGWFLEPLSWLPGMEPMMTLVSSFARFWVSLLLQIPGVAAA